ncbi:hypothetical protein ZTR_04957 [Talaromyces verruculosus]|nr:hypothetical protein ZTR_04957 [Talaromyces verruculosus]
MPVSAVKAMKKSAFSCNQCRKRKVKCGGEKPSCVRCTGRNESCAYKLSPTLSYTQKLEKRVQELEEALSIAQANGSSAVTAEQSPSNTVLSTTSAQKSTYLGPIKGLKVDEKGAVTYHGATSFFHLPTMDLNEALPARNECFSETLDDGNRRKEKLVHNAWQQRALEGSLETPEPFQFLLNIHWCWIQPLFNFVYRPAFTRDMEVLGPYYSHTLLNAILSHSVRWCKNNKEIQRLLDSYDDGALFSRQARSLVFSEISTGHPEVPTIQTLLLLSAQECSAGNRTQAWLYSGMAFRLIEDMGITFTTGGTHSELNLEDEDVEIRQRLFWSCYFWDKMVSLYLGRTPMLQNSGMSPDQVILDDSAEHEIWFPHGIAYPEGLEYPPTIAHSITCFRWMCRLSIIFNQILIHIYDPTKQYTDEDVKICLQNEEQSLKHLYTAASIFLLQMQAASQPDAQALTRLRFCINSLKRLCTSNPVIKSALGLITDSLSKMGLDMPPFVISANDEGKPVNGTVQMEIRGELSSAESNPTGHWQGFSEYLEPALPSFDPQEFTISDETLEAFPFLTPIDAKFGISYDQDH